MIVFDVAVLVLTLVLLGLIITDTHRHRKSRLAREQKYWNRNIWLSTGSIVTWVHTYEAMREWRRLYK